MEADRASVETLDALDLKSSKSITGQLEAGEEILLSCNANKHNKKSVMQKRLILITNKYVYNIRLKNTAAQLFTFFTSSLSIRRKIAITNIEAISISSYYLSDQFILHVPKEYDYRYSAVGKKRETIIKLICKEYREATGKKMTFYFSDNPDLKEYQTTDADVSAGISRMPKENPILLSDEDLEAKGLDYILKNKRAYTVKVPTIGPSTPITQYSEDIKHKAYNPSNNIDQITVTESIIFRKTDA